MKMPLTLLTHDVRSAHNIGAILRTIDAVGAAEVVLCGLTPTPKRPDDARLPHVIARAEAALAKTALGAQQSVSWQYQADAVAAARQYKQRGYHVYALEQAAGSLSLFEWQPRFPALLIVGNELTGLKPDLLDLADAVVEIPQFGNKESLNVATAAGIALYAARQSFQSG